MGTRYNQQPPAAILPAERTAAQIARIRAQLTAAGEQVRALESHPQFAEDATLGCMLGAAGLEIRRLRDNWDTLARLAERRAKTATCPHCGGEYDPAVDCLVTCWSCGALGSTACCNAGGVGVECVDCEEEVSHA